MSSYHVTEPGRQPGVRNVLRWLSHHKPVRLSFTDDNDCEQSLIIDQKNTKKWNEAYSNLVRMNACTVRALDGDGNTLASMVLRIVERDEERKSVDAPATHQGVDIAAIVNTVATAITSSVKDTMSAMADAHKQSFLELVNLAKQSNERAIALEKERDRLATERLERIEDEEDRVEEERERIHAEREAEKEDNKEMKEFMTPILQAAAPEIAKKVMGAFTSNGAAKDVAAKTAEAVVSNAKKKTAAAEGSGETS